MTRLEFKNLNTTQTLNLLKSQTNTTNTSNSCNASMLLSTFIKLHAMQVNMNASFSIPHPKLLQLSFPSFTTQNQPSSAAAHYTTYPTPHNSPHLRQVHTLWDILLPLQKLHRQTLTYMPRDMAMHEPRSGIISLERND